MAPTSGILYVTMQPKPELPAAQFHDWYNNDHGPTRLRLPWCLNGFRYRGNDGEFSAEKPEFMAIYDIEDMEWLTRDVYTRLRKAPVQSQRERDTMKQITVDRRFYDFVREWKSDEFQKLEEVRNEGRGNVIVSTLLTLHEGEDKEKEVKKWYAEEHVPLLQKVPGWRRTRTFVTSYLDLKEGKAKQFLNLHEYAPENGLGGPEFKAATSTPWMKQIYESVVKDKKRRSYDLFYTFGPAPRDLAALTDSSTFPVESTDALTRSFPSHASNAKYPAIESYITTPDGVQLPYRLEGSSDPNTHLLVCVNSILVDYHIWDTFVPAFLALSNNKYRVLRFNTRGRSSLPEDSTSPITVDTLSKDVITILDAVRAKTASIVGVSLGGATALNTALNYPDRITAFVSCDTNSAAPAANPKAWGDRIAMSEKQAAVSTSTNEPIVGSELAETTVRRWFVPDSYANEALLPFLERVKTMVETNSLDGFRKSVNALYQYDFREKMKGFEGKGAFLVGAGDGVLPKTMKEMAEGLGKGVHLEIVEGAGHLPMVEKPESVARFLAGFLEK